MSTGHPVTISVDDPAKGAITISPSSFEIEVGDWVVWKVRNDGNAPWLVFFEDGEGFAIRPEATPSAEKTTVHSVEVRRGQVAVATGKKKGIFQYKVAVSLRDTIYAVMNCPEVIIK